MATRGDGKRLCKRPFQPEIDEEPQNEADRNNSSGVSKLNTHQGGYPARIGKSELKQTLKQMTFTRSETQHLIALLHSRTIQESPSDAILSSRVHEAEIASPDKLADTYKDSTIVTSQSLRQVSELINNNATCLPKTPTASENLPNDLLSNIFIRLLAKQLAQMRSVSKSWNALLSQSSFIKSHLHRSIHNNHQILLHFSYPCAGFELLNNPHLQLTNSIKFPANPQSRHNSIRVIGCVNGLICSCYGDSVIHIWNPSLSAFLTLPPYSTPSGDYENINTHFRFGFDPKTNDYKLVKLTAFAIYSDEVIWWMDVEIYSMRKGSWNLINGRFPSHITWIHENEVVCVDGHDGRLHWLCCTNEELHTDTIVAFDLGSETFSEIPLPHSVAIYKFHRSKSLGVLDGKLCVMTWGENDVIEVWVMEEYGVAESWAKRHVFSQFSGDTYPFGFTTANKFLIQDHYSRLVSYDPVTEQAQILKDHCSYEEYEAGKIVEYVDSLVWVAPAKSRLVYGVRQS